MVNGKKWTQLLKFIPKISIFNLGLIKPEIGQNHGLWGQKWPCFLVKVAPNKFISKISIFTFGSKWPKSNLFQELAY